MKLTAPIKLLPSDGQAQRLLRTLERANEACQYISDYAHETGEHSKYKLQEAVYHDVRERFDLAAQMTIRALGKIADAYKTHPDAHNQFDIRGGFPYDSRTLSFYTDRQEVSIWTLDPTGDGGGREKISYEVGESQRALLGRISSMGCALLYEAQPDEGIGEVFLGGFEEALCIT